VEYAIGIDLGGSSVKAVAVTRDGQTLSKQNTNFDPDAAMDWAKTIKQMVALLETRQNPTAASALGLSAPGLASRDQQKIVCMPGRLQGLEGLNWTSFFKSKNPVPVLNDAHAALLGESWLGAARGLENVFMLTLGTGVGGAAIVDGKLLRGHIGRGGHLGHIALDPDGLPDVTGMPGSLEMVIGNCTIESRTHGRFATTHDLVAAYLKGDCEAASIWLESIKNLACGIGSLINVLDPEAVIIGGGIARSGAALFEPLQKALDQVEWRPTGNIVKLLPAQLGEFAGAYGAAHNALRD
jgi:glucokinase